jgi:ABC-type maltose transport system permease subunit
MSAPNFDESLLRTSWWVRRPTLLAFPGIVAILVAVPIAFVFNLFLDRFISGFTMGAVKG